MGGKTLNKISKESAFCLTNWHYIGLRPGSWQTLRILQFRACQLAVLAEFFSVLAETLTLLAG